ncbi:aromatic-L-amino-acid decarboxylase-like [Watersipora subatra]|uniref:aromatic-L-amino-acid decarboxylase-like n=1 Tax=Watersipora subatra TaxID=2589382 RepID=UPI00355B5EA9
MDSTEYQKHGKDMVDYIANYLETIRERRVFPNVSPGYMKELVPPEAPEVGENWEEIIGDVERVVMPGMTHWQSPHMHAYFPTTHSYPALLGDMLSDGINALGFTWASSPACTELEIICMDWLGQLIGLPKQFLHKEQKTLSGGGGVIQTTCSEATFVALLAARTEAIKRLRKENGMDHSSDALLASKLVCYCSEQAHSSVEKASLIGLVKLRLLPTDDEHRLKPDSLKECILNDRKQGLVPFYLCATLGTTGCCSFDSLEQLGPICEEEGMWLHVDAAYAGSAFVCPEFRHLLAGIEYAHSFVFNPSKWLLINFDCTAMWVKDSGALHCTFNVDPLYLQHENSGDAIDYMHWQIPLSRRFRALKLWFVLRAYGRKGLQAHIRKSVALGKFFENLVRKDDRFEIPAKRHLGLIVLRLKGANALTERLLKNLNKGGKVHMVPASLKGTYVIRFTITSTRTTEEDLIKDWKIIQDEASKLIADGGMSIELPSANEHGLAKTGPRRKMLLRRRYTWAHYNRQWDMSLLLSNVPVRPSVVNGTFAALYDNKDRRLSSSTDDVHDIDGTSKESSGRRGERSQQVTLKLTRKVLSLDTGFATMKAGPQPIGTNIFVPTIDEMSNSSAEELSLPTQADNSNVRSENKSEMEVPKSPRKVWLPDPANHLLDKLANLKVFRKLGLSPTSPNESGVIPDPLLLKAKQEMNGHYGVDG